MRDVALPSKDDKPEPELEVELEQDPEEVRVRKWREEQFVRAGFTPFGAFQLALLPNLDWHRVCDQRRAGASEAVLLDLYLDY